MIEIQIKNKKIIKVGKSFYYPIPKSLIELGIVDKNKYYTAFLKKYDSKTADSTAEEEIPMRHES